LSLKSKFKVDATLARDGKWFDVCQNKDGSKCRVKLRRAGRGNPLWSVAFREHTKDHDMDMVTPEEDEVITANIFAEANVADWEHFQPEDDGVELPFSVENARSILADPDWVELLKDWQGKANSLSAFQSKPGDPPTKQEEEAKN
jgi:hypothetical protein